MFGGAVQGSTFGAQGSVFGDAKAQAPVFGSSGGGIFGAANQAASPIGGGMMPGAGAPVFGQSATFGAKPVFGAPATEFGSKPVFGSAFGVSTFGGAANTGRIHFQFKILYHIF